MREIFFADNLKILLKKKGISGKSFADKMGLNENTFYSYTKGSNFPHVLTLLDMAEVLEVSLDDLMYTDMLLLSRRPQEVAKAEKSIWK